MNDTPTLSIYTVYGGRTGFSRIKLNPQQVKISNYALIRDPQVSTNGRWVYYTMKNTANRLDLYQSPINGPADDTLKLSNISIDNGFISSYVRYPCIPKSFTWRRKRQIRTNCFSRR